MSIPDDLQNELDRLMHNQNSHGLEEFEWYSPLEMQAILYSSFAPASPVQLRSMEEQDYQRVPLLNQARYIMEKIRQTGEVKLTDKGFLPTALVKDIHSQGYIKEYFLDEYKKDKVIREFDSYAVHMTRMLLEETGLIKKRKGKLSLTKRGEKLLSEPGLLLFHLLHTYCFSFNLAFFDGYGQNNIVRLGWAFTIILLSKYGRQERPNTFYAEKHFHAFPAMIHEVENTYIRDQQKISYNCYSHRMLEHFMQHLGVIEINYERYFDEVRNITATDLVWKLFQVQAPYTARRWN